MDSRLFWLALAAFVGGTEGGLIIGLLPSISEEMRVTMGEAGLIVSAAALSYGVGAPLLAVVLGSVGRRRVLAGAVVTLAIAAALFAISPFFLWMVGARMLIAVAGGTFAGTAMAVAAAIAAPGQRGRAMQVITLGQSLAVLLGVPVAAFVATKFGWRIDYGIIAVLAAAAALALYLKLPKGMHGDTQTMTERVRVLSNTGVRPALLTTFLLMMGTNLPYVYVGAILEEAEITRIVLFSYDLPFIPFVLLANGIGAVAASTTFGHLADHFGNWRLVMLSMIVQIGVLSVFIALPHLPLEWREATLFLNYVTFGYFGWGYWIAHCSQMAHLAPSSVPVAISLDMAALNIGIAIAAAVGGFIVDRWSPSVVSMVAILLALAAMAVWRSIRAPAPATVANG